MLNAATSAAAPSRNFFIDSLQPQSSLRALPLVPRSAFVGTTAHAIQMRPKSTPNSTRKAVSQMQHSAAKWPKFPWEVMRFNGFSAAGIGPGEESRAGLLGKARPARRECFNRRADVEQNWNIGDCGAICG